jgi:hypothetical protein
LIYWFEVWKTDIMLSSTEMVCRALKIGAMIQERVAGGDREGGRGEEGKEGRKQGRKEGGRGKGGREEGRH